MDNYSCGELSLDTDMRVVTAAGTQVALTKTECAIMALLLQNPGRILARRDMLAAISDAAPGCTDRSLKQHVSNLRRKLSGAAGIDPIESIWGAGFRLCV